MPWGELETELGPTSRSLLSGRCIAGVIRLLSVKSPLLVPTSVNLVQTVNPRFFWALAMWLWPFREEPGLVGVIFP